MAPDTALFRFRFLGGFELCATDGSPIELPTRKCRLLLAYLANPAGQRHAREKLTGLLWPNSQEEQARGSLRHALTALRTALGSDVIAADRDFVSLKAGRAASDVEALAAAAGEAGAADDIAALYRGEFLEGLSVGGEELSDWLAFERNRCRSLAQSALERAIAHLEGQGRTSPAIALARRLIALDPLREKSHRLLMRLLEGAGERSKALEQAQELTDLLERELGVAPSPETLELASNLRAGAASAGPALAPASLPDRADVPDDGASQAAPTPVAIVVAPFASLADTPDGVLFARGMTEDIITELARFQQLRVLAQGSMARHSGATPDLKRLCREVGASYLVEGSVRKLGPRLRITAQLIDARSGHHLWAEKFDEDSEDIFAVQDRVVRTIVATLAGRLSAAEVEVARRKPPASLAAYECVLRAEAQPIQVPEAEAEARRLLEKALELDPGYARAYALMSDLLVLEWSRDMSGSGELLARALALAKRSVLLDGNDAICQGAVGWVHLHLCEYELAAHHLDRALELNPSRPTALTTLGLMHAYAGEPGRGADFFEQARRIDVLFDPPWYWRMLGIVHALDGRYEEAIADFYRSPQRPAWVSAYLAACHVRLGRREEARRHAEDALRNLPSMTVAELVAKDPIRDAEVRRGLMEAMREAGLPG